MRYLVGNGAPFNTSAASLYVDAADLGLAQGGPFFVTAVYSVGREGLELAIPEPVPVDLAAMDWAVDVNELVLGPKQHAQVKVTLAEPGKAVHDILVVYPDNAAGAGQADVIPIHVPQGKK